MLFSIIVPVYKVEQYLPYCVDSLLAQSFQDFEIILVNDGSPDGCPALCDCYAAKDSRITVIHKENGGVNSARRAGVAAAKGDYLVFVDSDDSVSPDYLKTFRSIVLSHAPDLICCGHSLHANGSFTEKKPAERLGFYNREAIVRELFPHLIEDAYCRYFMPSLWAKAFKKELYRAQQLPADKPIKIGEDGACTVPCVYAADSLYITDACLYYYRLNDTSAVNAKRAFPWEDLRMKAAHIASRLDLSEGDLQAQLDRLVVHGLFNVAASRFNQKKPYGEIAGEIRQALCAPDYAAAIKRCQFRGKKGRLALFALKHKQIFLIRLFNRIRWK